MSQPAANGAAMLDDLRLLCAQPTVTGETRALEDGVDSVMAVLRSNGLACRLYATPGAPIVVGRYDGGHTRTLLLYARYDLPPAGQRRTWRGDPFQLSLRDGRVFARGSVAKAELVARAAALRRLIELRRVPCNIVFVVEGESLIGSPNLGAVAGACASASWALWSGGSCGAAGVPLLYAGVKGLLRVELRAQGARSALPISYAATTPNPLWNLVAALASIKSSFEEITIEGFYDDVAALDRETLATVRGLDLGEEARRDAWGLERFVANLQGPMLARAESFSPSCNLSAIEFSGNAASVPSHATAQLQFQLVPDQQPETVYRQLVAHLAANNLAGVTAIRLDGHYAPRVTSSGALGRAAATAGSNVYGVAPRIISLAPFAAPASLLVPSTVPLIACGLERPDSSLYGPDESVSLADLESHTRFIGELIAALG
jgi:acetylornithine deacetylase/succinyl-diaminopimelate desuccinylase-like protein